MADDQTASDDFVEITTDAPEQVAELEVTPAEGTVEEVTDDKAESEEKTDEAKKEQLRDEEGRFKGSVQDRIDKLTLARRTAERERDAAVAQLQKANTGSNAAPTSKPTADQFEDYGDYVEALTDWKVADRERTNNTARATTAAETAETHRQEEWGAKIGAAKASIADFDAVMDKADTPTLPHVAQALMDADRGPELLYHLAQNPDLVGKLNDMSPYRAAIELGKLEATLEAPAEKPKPRETSTSKAPAPITPVQPGSSASKDPSKMSMDEYAAFRKANGVL